MSPLDCAPAPCRRSFDVETADLQGEEGRYRPVLTSRGPYSLARLLSHADLRDVEVTFRVRFDRNTEIVESGSEVDIRPEIFRFAVDNGLSVLTLQKERQSLEEVFKQLTIES